MLSCELADKLALTEKPRTRSFYERKRTLKSWALNRAEKKEGCDGGSKLRDHELGGKMRWLLLKGIEGRPLSMGNRWADFFLGAGSSRLRRT